MAHLRERYLTASLLKALRFSPAVGILGQRQTGKTTLVSKIAQDYISLDERRTLDLALVNPDSLLTSRKYPFAIDECQLAPPLFPAIKEFVRLNPGPGRFILTGSVRFTSRKAIRESLTGRIFNLELLPLSLAEAHQMTLSELPLLVLKKSEKAVWDYLAGRKTLSQLDLYEYLKTGGLPGICFHRDDFIRSGKFTSHLETLLERDLRLLVSTKLSYSSLSNLLSILARRQGMPLDLSEISRVSRLSRPTVRQFLRVFESLFLIRMVPALGGTMRPTLFFEDQGLATHLSQTALDPYTDLNRLIFSTVFPQFHYRPELNSRIFHYLTRGGARAPLVIQTKVGTVAYVPELDSVPSSSAITSARSFKKSFPDAHVLIVHQGKEARVLEKRMISIPLKHCG